MLGSALRWQRCWRDVRVTWIQDTVARSWCRNRMYIFTVGFMKGAPMCVFIAIADLSAVAWRTHMGGGTGGDPHHPWTEAAQADL